MYSQITHKRPQNKCRKTGKIALQCSFVISHTKKLSQTLLLFNDFSINKFNEDKTQDKGTNLRPKGFSSMRQLRSPLTHLEQDSSKL